MGAPATAMRRTFSLSILLALVAGFFVGTTSTVQAADLVLDGTTQGRAAVSCWEIKQIKPTSPSGKYWLLTPQLKAPQQFYCDMDTDGGGWVLVGRGRDGWTADYNGRGTTAEVADVITGVEAFSPKQLDARVINGLLGGRRLDQIAPELRVRRSRNNVGTVWQEIRATVAKSERWTWAMGAGIPLSSVSFDGAQLATNVTTRDIAVNDYADRVFTFDNPSNGFVRGWNFGYWHLGTDSPTTYLYSKVAGGHYATPFAQVFIRPKLRKADVVFDRIADSGTAVSTLPKVPNNGAKLQSWGVSGLGAGGTSETATLVQAFEQVGNLMIVGGNFTSVVRGENAAGADIVNQSYLAGFNPTSGDYVSTFKPPTFDNQVKTLAELPGNRVAVGGDFTLVNGQPRAGFVVLDATTGAVDTAWSTVIENRLKGGRVSVKALDVAGDYLYFGGAMTHFVDGTRVTYAKGAGRMKISTRQAETGWNPEFNGSVYSLDVSADGSRVYYAGYFTAAGTTVADRAAAFSTAAGAPRITPTWQPTFSTAGVARYQQAVKEAGNRVWLGGSQHSMFGYNRNTFQLEKQNFTKHGGDIQVIEEGDGMVYAGCHCEHYNFSDTGDFDGYGPGNFNAPWSTADTIYYIGAWDAASGNYAADFTPEMRATEGRGVWAIEVADDGTVWAGGALTAAVTEGGKRQWVGGFTRFGMRDSAAPGTPSGLRASVTNGQATVSWSGVSGATAYEVLRNDRVVATVTSAQATIPDSIAGDRFFVRAVDARGNRSASTSVTVATAGIASTELLSNGATWKYFAGSSVLPSTWATPRFDDAAWASGAAPLGFGSSAIKTQIPVTENGQRAVVSYYRNSFNIPAGTTVGEVRVSATVDDGVAVYVNGVEIGRSNLPAGTLTNQTYAASAPRSSATLAAPVTWVIPQNLLRQGQNTIAISSHLMYKSSPDAAVEAKVVADAGNFAPPVVGERVQLVKEADTWNYLFNNDVAAPATWKTAATGTEAWKSGAAPLGWGHSAVATNIDVAAGQTRSLTSYYRKTFTVDDPSAFASLLLRSRADDGIVIYLNGVEVNRTRIPAGTVTKTTYATQAVSTATALGTPIELQLASSLLRQGTNTLAVEVHSNSRATANHTMAVELVGQP